MLEKPYLLMDAGGTTVFPNPGIIIEFAQNYGIHLTDEKLHEGYYRLINLLDTQEPFPRNPWPVGYTQALFDVLKLSTPEVKKVVLDVNNYHKHNSLWTFTYPWVYTTLSKLRKLGYRMSILSNSDGRTKQIFDELNLSQYFEHIFDSKDLNCEKPDRRIFDIVLDQLDINPKGILYIGDIYKVDVLGANRAGIGGVHLDPLQLYRSRPGIHIDNITFLESWLASYLNYPAGFTPKLFPFSNKSAIEPISKTGGVFSKKHLSEMVTH